jgi:capsid protein
MAGRECDENRLAPYRSFYSRLIAQVQNVIDDFISTNHWHNRQQEIVRRKDRDGEALLQFFVAHDGSLRIRFIEPDQVFTPPAQVGNPAARLGILTDPNDVETVIGFFVDGQLVDAADIQQRKANVDANVRRGLPLFYPVRKNLRRAEKLLRNMSVVAEIQSAIALIRKHRQGTATGVQQFVVGQADATLTSRATGQTRTFRRYGPGTILDANANIEYDFPAASVDAANFVTVLQAELRAVASRLVMPEFMLTSDASNANYSSTMVAEGPAMRMFARLQAEQVCDDLEVMWRVVNSAMAAGKLPSETATLVNIQAVPPSLEVLDPLQEAQRFRIENAAGILSPQTWSQRDGLDYDQEQANFAAYKQQLVHAQK